jgi:hypothetical protein
MAKKLNKATWTREPAQQESEEEKRIRAMAWYEKLDKGLEHGVEKTGQGMVQGAYHLGSSLGMDVDTEKVDAWVREEAEKREPYDKYGGGWHTTGDILGVTASTAPAMLLPGGQATALGRAGMGALTGAGIMGSQPVTDENYASGKTGQVAFGAGVGAGLGLALPPLIEGAVDLIAGMHRGALKAWDTVSGKTLVDKSRQMVDDWMEQAGIEINHLGAEAKESFYKQIAEQLQAPQASTEAGRKAVESARRLPYKVDLTKGQVTKKFEDVSKETRMLKTDSLGDPLRQRKMEQNEALVKSLEYLKEKTAGGKTGAPEAEDIGARYDTFTKDRLKNLQDTEVTPAYNKITEQYGDDFVELSNVEAKILELKNSGAYEQSRRIKGVVDRLEAWVNVSRDPKAFTSTAGEGLSGRLNVRQAENYRKTTTEFADDWTPTEGKYINELMDSLEADVVNAVGKDVYEPARAIATKRFDERDAYKLPASRSTADTVGKVRRLKEPELEQWANTMKGTTDGHGIFDDTRARILEDVIEKSLNKSQTDALGYPLFDQRVFVREIGALGKRRREILFDERENQIIEDMITVGQRRVPPRDTQNPSGTAQELVNWIGSLAQSIPFSGFVGNLVRRVLGPVTSSAKSAMRGDTGKAVQEHLHPFKPKPGAKRPRAKRIGRAGGIVSAQELMGN